MPTSVIVLKDKV